MISSVLILRKGEKTPLYDESIVVRGYDNVEYVNRIRFSGWIGQLVFHRLQVWDAVCGVFLPSSGSGVMMKWFCYIVCSRML